MHKSSQLAASLEILSTIDSGSGSADMTLRRWGKHNRFAGAKDRKAISTIVYGILRNKAQIDWWCTRFRMPTKNRMRALVYLHFTEKDLNGYFQQTHKHGAAPLQDLEKAFLSKLGEATSMVHEDMPVDVVLNVTPWILDVIKPVFPKNASEELTALNTQAPTDIRINTLKTCRADVAHLLQKAGVETHALHHIKQGLRLHKRYPLLQMQCFKEGLFEIQDEGSQIVGKLLQVKRGDKVLDFCAGTGGKTLALAAMLENTGKIIACDISQKRLQQAKNRLKRAGVHNTECRVLSSERDKWVKRHSARFNGGFYKILLDVPCSGSGTWRRNPDQKWRLNRESLQELVTTQSNILGSAKRLLSPGGKMVYSTCSLLREENEHQIEKFLAQNHNFTLVDITKVWRSIFDTKCPTKDKMLRLTPYKNNTDGFFIAIVERKR